MTLIQQQIKSVFASLPQQIRDLITTEDFNDRIEVIAKKHELDVDQTGALIRTTMRLLIGVVAPTAFIPAITESTEVEREKASFIAQDINQNIFNPVKEELKKVHAIEAGKSGVTASPLPSVLPQKTNATTQNASTPATPAPTPPSPPKPVSTVSSPVPLPKLSEIAAAHNDNNDRTDHTGKTAERPQPPQTPPLSAPSQSIFEQKMGGTFRMKSDATSHVGGVPTQGAANSSEVRPPKADERPRAATSAPSAVMPNPATPPKVDPYREATS